jgi:hypothetical protein
MSEDHSTKKYSLLEMIPKSRPLFLVSAMYHDESEVFTKEI